MSQRQRCGSRFEHGLPLAAGAIALGRRSTVLGEVNIHPEALQSQSRCEIVVRSTTALSYRGNHWGQV